MLEVRRMCCRGGFDGVLKGGAVEMDDDDDDDDGIERL